MPARSDRWPLTAGPADTVFTYHTGDTMSETREQYRERLLSIYDTTYEQRRMERGLERHDEANEQGLVPVSTIMDVEESAAQDAAEAVAAQVLRDVYRGLDEENNHHRKTPVRSLDMWFIERFAKARGIDLEDAS